jgi:hypothetical protein
VQPFGFESCSRMTMLTTTPTLGFGWMGSWLGSRFVIGFGLLHDIVFTR